MKDAIDWIKESAGVVDADGFLASGVACDVRGKADGRLDLGLIWSERDCAAAAVFTRNSFAAAPVLLGRARLAAGAPLRGVVVNSGNANACTGARGLEDAERMAARFAARMGVAPEAVWMGSTGRIGVDLPIERIEAGIDAGVKRLGRAAEAGFAAADAILTSDTRRKVAGLRVQLSGGTVTMAGMAKGAGMIEPNMATMLAYLVTDAQIEGAALQQLLTRAVAGSFNAVTVDGDRSTNDTVLLMANGARGVGLACARDQALFAEALERLCLVLAEKIVGDGEKISKVVELDVYGGRDHAAAERVARAIGNSLLVKSSWYGNDPNWGRILDVVGYADTALDPAEVALAYESKDGTVCEPVYNNGARCGDVGRMRAIVRAKQFRIRLGLGSGSGQFRLLATDLTEGYVNFNKAE